MNYFHLFLVGVGGMIGSIGRYLASKAITHRADSMFPYGTLTVNIIGSFILGIVFSVALRKNISPVWMLFLGTGICGGFTTFSAFSVENFNLLQQKPLVSLIYISTSLAGGILSAAAGIWLGRSL